MRLGLNETHISVFKRIITWIVILSVIIFLFIPGSCLERHRVIKKIRTVFWKPELIDKIKETKDSEFLDLWTIDIGSHKAFVQEGKHGVDYDANYVRQISSDWIEVYELGYRIDNKGNHINCLGYKYKEDYYVIDLTREEYLRIYRYFMYSGFFEKKYVINIDYYRRTVMDKLRDKDFTAIWFKRGALVDDNEQDKLIINRMKNYFDKHFKARLTQTKIKSNIGLGGTSALDIIPLIIFSVKVRI